MEWAKNKPGHGEEQSDVAIQLEIQMDCRARQPGLAMTNHEFISRCAKRAVAIQLDCFVAALLAMTVMRLHYYLMHPRCAFCWK